jgi:monothiol glutaredoxin
MNVQDRIRQQVEENAIILYMKGTPDFPQCGFSGRAAQLLKACGVPFAAVNILADREIAEGLPRFANWPTFPQLFVRGQLIGGSDIMLEMYQKGELQKLVAEAQAGAKSA